MNEVNVLNGLIDYCDRKGYCIDYYDGCCEPGYEDKPVIAADWNPAKMEKIGNLIEKMETVEIEWSDEWSRCDDCYKAVRTSPNSYDWQPYFIIGDVYMVCGDCAMDQAEEYIQEYVNNNNRAIPSWFIQSAKDIGFDCLEDCKVFESGSHPGQNDTPEKALQEIYDGVGEGWFQETFDYIFVITGTGQFDLSWSIFVRPTG